MDQSSRSKWLRKWKVSGSDGKDWIVSQDKEGNFGCSCPVWRYKRQECKHIQEIKTELKYMKERGKTGNMEEHTINKPKYILAMVGKPTFKPETNELYIPLVKIGDLHMEATICHNLLKHGYTMDEVRQLRNISADHLNAQKIRKYIEAFGEAEYKMRTPGTIEENSEDPENKSEQTPGRGM